VQVTLDERIVDARVCFTGVDQIPRRCLDSLDVGRTVLLPLLHRAIPPAVITHPDIEHC
jgi:hypothetical protein